MPVCAATAAGTTSANNANATLARMALATVSTDRSALSSDGQQCHETESDVQRQDRPRAHRRGDFTTPAAARASVAPPTVVPLTVTLSSQPASAGAGTYDGLIAPAMSVHAEPFTAQRCHW
jgi:hypothetical protein